MNSKLLKISNLQKRFKLDHELFSLLIEKGIIGDRGFYSEAETEILKSFSKLRRLGYSSEACIKVLKEVGAPKDENLFENQEYIQLKDLSKTTDISERTIKFYEKSSIITKPRIYRNKRFYRRETAGELELIRDLQRLGYQLNTISALLLALREDNSDSRSAIENLIKEIESRKALADSIIAKLREYI